MTASDPSPNPLLAVAAQLPARGRVRLPFDEVRPEHVKPAIEAVVTEARRALDLVGAGGCTYDAVLGELERATEPVELVAGIVEHLEATMSTPALRDAWGEARPLVTVFYSELGSSAAVYRAVNAVFEWEGFARLSAVQQRHVEKTRAELRRSGAALTEADRQKLLALDTELARLTLEFGRNVLDATNAFELIVTDVERLRGLPESALAAARASAATRGIEGYRLTLQQPSYVPAMTYLDDGELRRTLYEANVSRCLSGAQDNEPLVKRILALRGERARLLGYASFADLVTEERMAKTGAGARGFVADLRARTLAAFVRENDELERYRAELVGAGQGPMQAHDVAYFAEKLRRARYDFDAEVLRAYFPLDRVLEGLFSLSERLFGVRAEQAHDVPTWHPTARPYHLVGADGHALADFWVDPFPREEKRDGAWMHGLHCSLGGPAERHAEVIVMNFTPPPAGGGQPLLRHAEVETLFHEFGHLLHHALSEVPVRSLAGTSVSRDFVELPSQILENWCWEREALALFAGHVDTGEPIPSELFDRMRAARTFRAANAAMRQLGFAELDLVLHDLAEPGTVDLLALAREVAEAHSPAPLPASYAMVLSFSHLFSDPVGYAAGYYSYKWAEVLDADAFGRFRDEGLLSREVGMAFRREILARGDSAEPEALFRAFRGREPTVDALLARDGLLAS
jgi:oligopeptidase A